MKRAQVISSLVALGFGCTIGALALAMSGGVAAARELGAAELAGVVGGNEQSELFQNKTCKRGHDADTGLGPRPVSRFNAGACLLLVPRADERKPCRSPFPVV